MQINGVQLQSKPGMEFREQYGMDFMSSYNVNQFANSQYSQQFALEKVGQTGELFRSTTDHSDALIGSNGLKVNPDTTSAKKLNLIG